MCQARERPGRAPLLNLFKGRRGARGRKSHERIGAWPSGKATGFGPVILGSNPSAPATQSRDFRLSPDTPQSVGKKPGIAPPNGGRSLLLETGERVSAEERRLAPGLSLLGIFGGHTSTDFGALENDAGGAGSNCHRRITTAIQPTTSARGNHEVRRRYSGCTARVHRVQDFEEVADDGQRAFVGGG